MARSFAASLLILGLPLAGCAVAAGLPSSSDLAVNRCESDSECSGGQCIEQICHATNGKLSSLVVTVTPAQSGGTYFLDYPAMGTLASSGVTTENVSVPPLVQLRGLLRVDVDKKICTPSFILLNGTSQGPNTTDNAIPGDIYFRRSRRIPGMPVDTYRGVVDPNGYTFSVNVPPDEYDIYIRPLKQPIDKRGDTPCAVPPRLLLKQAVTGNLDFKLVAASTLDVHVVWAKGQSPAGWVIDLVDPSTGYALSVPRTLTNDDFISETTLDTTYAVTLDYVPTYGPDDKGVLQPLPIGTAVVRLTPPADADPLTPSADDVVAPVLLAQLTGTALCTEDPCVPLPAEVRQSKLLPAPVTVQFQLDLASDGSPTAGSVTLTATDLPGFSLATSFTRTVTVDEGGIAEVTLVPGTYRVVATPAAACDPTSCLGTRETTWVVPPSPSMQAGKLIELADAATVAGHAEVASGAPAVGATVRAIASPSILDLNVMNQGDAKAAILPRAAFGQVDAQGDFFFGADGGTYDFRVEPNPDTGFAWLVHPKVKIDATEGEYLGNLSVPLPIVYRGQITSGSGEAQMAVPSALIRAFVYVAPNGKVTRTPSDSSVAVQVAETHADSSGAYTLLIPTDLDPL